MKRAKEKWQRSIEIAIALVTVLVVQPAVGARVPAHIFTKAPSQTSTTPLSTTEDATDPQTESPPQYHNATTAAPEPPAPSPKPKLTGIPQIDYLLDPNLPRELNGYNLSEYPFYEYVPPPETMSFKCDGLHDGFYASVPHKCQVYHHCLFGIRYDFLCANYTAFDQKNFICHFVSKVDCVNSPNYFSRNEALYKSASETSSAQPQIANLSEVVQARASILNKRRPNKGRRVDHFQNDALYQEASTTTVAPSTTQTTTTTQSGDKNRGGAGGRRRPAFRRRRPQYDYYAYDDEYDDDEFEYEDSRRPYRRRQRPRNHKRPMYDEYEDDRYDRRPTVRPRSKPEEEYDDRRITNRPRPTNRRPNYDDRRSMSNDRRQTNDDRRQANDDRRQTNDDRRQTNDDRRPLDEDRRSSQDRRPLNDDRRTTSDDRRNKYDDKQVINTDRRPLDEEDKRTPSYYDRKGSKPLDDKRNMDNERPRTRRPQYNEERNRHEKYEPTQGGDSAESYDFSQEDSPKDEGRSFASSSATRNHGSGEGFVKPAGASIYSKPRIPPRIRRPVPVGEREKFDYVTTSTAKPATVVISLSKHNDEEYYDEYENDDPKHPSSSFKSSSVSKPKVTHESAERERARAREEPRNKPDYSRRAPSRKRPVIPKRPVEYEDSYEEEYASKQPTKLKNNKQEDEYEELADEEHLTKSLQKDDTSANSRNEDKHRHFGAIVQNAPIEELEEVEVTSKPIEKDTQQSYVRVAKRPFLPSRGGSPYLPRGLKPVGGKTIAPPKTPTTTQPPPTTTTVSTTTTTTTEAVYVEYDYDVEDPKAFEPASEDVAPNKQVDNVRVVEYEDIQTNKDKSQSEYVDPYNSLRTATSDYKESDDVSNSDANPALKKDVPITTLSPNYSYKQHDVAKNRYHYDSRHGTDAPTFESITKPPKPIPFQETEFKPSPQISASYVPTSRPYTVKIPENISIKQNIADPVDKDYDATLNDALSPTLPNLAQIRHYPSGFIVPADRDYTYSRFRNQAAHYATDSNTAASEHSASYQSQHQDSHSSPPRQTSLEPSAHGDYLVGAQHVPVTRSTHSYYAPQPRHSVTYGDDVVSRIRIRPGHSYYEIAS